MTPFRLKFQPGQPIVDQVVFAAIKAIVSGELVAGDPFPSVRALAADLKIHPNTAHKVVQHLVRVGWLEVQTGIGTLVADRPVPKDGRYRRQLGEKLDHIVVEATSAGLSLEELSQEIAKRWDAINNSERVA